MIVQAGLAERGDQVRWEIPAPDVTLLQLIHALFWELSFFGAPEKRGATEPRALAQSPTAAASTQGLCLRMIMPLV